MPVTIPTPDEPAVPIVIPTADEVGRMSWRARQVWDQRRLAILAQVQRSEPHLWAVDFDLDDPHAWEDFYGQDPDWQEHQRILLEAIS